MKRYTYPGVVEDSDVVENIGRWLDDPSGSPPRVFSVARAALDQLVNTRTRRPLGKDSEQEYVSEPASGAVE